MVSPHDGCIPTHQGGETLALVGPQVPRILQQQKASLLEGGFFVTAEAPHFAPPDFIHRPVQMLDPAKAVEEDLSLRSVVANGLEISLPPVETNHADRGRAAPAQLRKEAGQGFLSSILAHSKERSAFQVICHHQPVMFFVAAHIINA